MDSPPTVVLGAPHARHGVDVRWTGIVMIGTALARASGYLREAVMAALFGATGHTDAFFAALRVQGLASSFGANSLGRVVVPLYAGHLARGEDEEAQRFLDALLGAILATLLAVSGALFVLAPTAVRVIAPGFGADEQRLAVTFTRILAGSIVLVGLADTLASVLEARRRFVAAALGPVVYNGGYIAALVALGPVLGLAAAAVGLIAGYAGKLAAVGRALVTDGVRLRPRWDLAHAGVRTAFRLYRPVIVALLVLDAWALAEAAIASSLPAGSLSYLNYAYRFIQVPVAVFIGSIGTVAFPRLSALAVADDLRGVREATALGLRMTLFVVVPAAIASAFIAQPLITLFLERGAFGAEAARATATALQMYAAGMAGLGVVHIGSRSFFALHDTRTPALLDASGVAVAIVVSLGLVGGLGHAGLALGFSIGMTTQALASVFILGKRIGAFWDQAFVRFIRQLAGAGGFAGICTYGVATAVGGGHPLQVLVALATASVGSYIVAANVLRIEELRLVVAALRRQPSAGA